MERLAFLDRRMRERGWVTASEAARAFEVSPRQIKRDIEYLRWRLDAPVTYDGGHRGYRYEKPFHKLRFSDERRVLFGALVQGWAASDTFRMFHDPELISLLAKAIPREYRIVADRIRYHGPAVDSVDLDVFARICQSLREGKAVNIRYRNLEGKLSERPLEVQRLVNYGGAWYLAAWDRSRQSLRTFHMGRIEQIELIPGQLEKAVGSPGWESQVDQWVSSGSGIFQGPPVYWAIVRLRSTARRLAQGQTWHPQQIDQEGHDAEGDFVDRSVPLADPREWVGRLLALGADAEAIGPEEFRSQWEQAVKALQDRLVRSSGPSAGQ